MFDINSGDIRRWHRRAGIVVAPFLFLQGVSGLILSYGLFARVSSTLADEASEPVHAAWNLFMAKMHYGPGLLGWIYHSLIGIGLLWMVLSGAWIWWSIRRRKQGESPQR